jgi:hypothetical protein
VTRGAASSAVLALAAAAALPPPSARAEPEPAPARARRIHGSIGAGGAVLLTGGRGDRGRFDAAIDVKLRGRFGALAAWRAFDDAHRGLLTAGLVYEAAAARPRLVLDLYAVLGADLDAAAPVAGGGLRTTLALAGPIGVVLDAGGHLVIDGIAETRLQLQSSALFSVRW